MTRPLDGLLVVALEQAVAAPYCSSRLADAGARVIKVERAEGDFARAYDRVVEGESSYFVWLNRGKESIVLDIKAAGDKALLERMIAEADVFIQNLAPGAAARAGFDAAELRARHPRLVTCDISGYGDQGPYARMKSYDLLVQRPRPAWPRLPGGPRGRAGSASRSATWAPACTPPWRSWRRSMRASATAGAAGSRCPCSTPWPTG